MAQSVTMIKRPGFFPRWPVLATLAVLALALVGPGPSEASADPGSRPLKIRLRGATLATAPTAVTVADLDRLPQTELTTFDPYLQRQIRYRGVLLRDLAASFGSPGVQRIMLKAIDAYQVEFVRNEWETSDFLLATRLDGDLMGLQQSGPAKIVRRYDPAASKERNFAPKWIWLVNRIEFLTE